MAIALDWEFAIIRFLIVKRRKIKAEIIIMQYQVALDEDSKTRLKNIWLIDEQSDILDMTAFADFFVRNKEGAIFFYNVTDGEKIDVTTLVNEHGLPPVSIELGGDWYQLDALTGLFEGGCNLQTFECFGFALPLFAGGEYQAENIHVMDIFSYHQKLSECLNLG